MVSRFKRYYSLALQFLGKAVLVNVVLSMLVSFFLFGIESFFAFVMQGFLICLGVMERTSVFLPSWYPKSLIFNLVFLMLLGLSRSLASGLIYYLSGMTRQEFLYRTRNRIVSYALSFPNLNKTSDTVSNFSDISVRSGDVVRAYTTFFVHTFLVASFFAYGCYLSPKEFLLASTSLLFIFFIMKYIDKKLSGVGMGITTEWKTSNLILIDGLKHNLLFKLYNLIGKEIKRADESLTKFRNYYQTFLIFNALKTQLPSFFGILVIAMVTYAGVSIFATNGEILIAVFYIFMRFVYSIGQIISSLAEIKLNLPAFKMLYSSYVDYEKLINKQKKIDPLSDKVLTEFCKSLSNNGVKISVEHVSFKYIDDAEYVIGDLSFEIGKGDVLGITGRSGSGKSTLLALVLGIYPANKGKVSINGFPVAPVVAALSSFVGYVSCDPFWFSGTLREILLFGHPDSCKVRDEEIYKMLEVAEALNFVNELEKRLDTFLGEQGELSTGQKQRLSIARALLRNPKLLILDEFTANLDVITEEKILKNMENIFPNITTLMVTHREQLISKCNQHVKLRDGVLIPRDVVDNPVHSESIVS